MNLTRRTFHRNALAAGLALGLPLGLTAARAASEHSGPFNTLARPLPTQDKTRIEVIEFFWYGCPHCRQVDPAVEAWERTLPKDVGFRREHVLWEPRRETVGHTRLFATLRSMGLVPEHQRAVFDGIHANRLKLHEEAAAFDWAASRGIDRAAFETTYKSFGVATQVVRAKQMTADYGVNEVPMFYVNGKYSTSLHQAGDERKTFAVIESLVAEERKAKR